MRSLTNKLAAIALVLSCAIPLAAARAEEPSVSANPACEAQQEADLWREAHTTRAAYASWAWSISEQIRVLNRRADPVDRFLDDFLTSESRGASSRFSSHYFFSIFSPLPFPSGTYIVHVLPGSADPSLVARLISAAKARFPMASVARSKDPFGIKKSQPSTGTDPNATKESNISIKFKHRLVSDFVGARAAIAKLRAQEEPKGRALYNKALAADEALVNKLLDADPPFFPKVISPYGFDEPSILLLKASTLP